MPQFYLIMGFCFCLNFGMYLNGMVPSYVHTLAVGSAVPMLGAWATSLSMAAQTGTKLGLGYVGEKHPFSGAVACIAMGIVGAVLGVLMILDPFDGAAALMIYMGVSLLLAGVESIYTVICLSRAFKSDAHQRVIDAVWHEV